MTKNERSTALRGGIVLTPEGNLAPYTLIYKNGKIEDLLNPDEKINPDICVINVDGFYIVPGFIDSHTHGSNGYNFMNANEKALSEISKSISAGGVTSCLATSTSANIDAITNLIDFVLYHNKSIDLGTIDLVGVHMEGPYINPLLNGSHNKNNIRNPQSNEINKIIKEADGVLKVVTIAPEIVGAYEAISLFKENGIRISIGHTNATYEQTKIAISKGATRATHIFNSMRQFHHREPGPAMALLENPDVFIEVIADGNHINPIVLSFLVKLIGCERIILITDRTDVAGLPDGTYARWEGTNVLLKGGKCVSKDGKLAGSTLKMNEAVRNIISFANVSLSDALRMASEVPAKSIGIINEKGNFIRGKDADIVVLDKELSVKMTIVKGRVVFNDNI